MYVVFDVFKNSKFKALRKKRIIEAALNSLSSAAVYQKPNIAFANVICNFACFLHFNRKNEKINGINICKKYKI